jgi:hypothetical protein
MLAALVATCVVVVKLMERGLQSGAIDERVSTLLGSAVGAGLAVVASVWAVSYSRRKEAQQIARYVWLISEELYFVLSTLRGCLKYAELQFGKRYSAYDPIPSYRVARVLDISSVLMQQGSRAQVHLKRVESIAYNLRPSAIPALNAVEEVALRVQVAAGSLIEACTAEGTEDNGATVSIPLMLEFEALERMLFRATRELRSEI